MPPPDDRESLWDIRDAARFVALAMSEIDEGLRRRDDWVVEAAIERKLGIVGEAVKRLTPGFRESHPEVDWRMWAGLRDVIVHKYDDLNQTWLDKIALVDVQRLLAAIQSLIPEDDEPGNEV
jgi:uncharacterized protein with HEPN domain